MDVLSAGKASPPRADGQRHLLAPKIPPSHDVHCTIIVQERAALSRLSADSIQVSWYLSTQQEGVTASAVLYAMIFDLECSELQANCTVLVFGLFTSSRDWKLWLVMIEQHHCPAHGVPMGIAARHLASCSLRTDQEFLTFTSPRQAVCLGAERSCGKLCCACFGTHSRNGNVPLLAATRRMTDSACGIPHVGLQRSI